MCLCWLSAYGLWVIGRLYYSPSKILNIIGRFLEDGLQELSVIGSKSFQEFLIILETTIRGFRGMAAGQDGG